MSELDAAAVKVSLENKLFSTADISIIQNIPKRTIHNQAKIKKIEPIYTTPSGTNFYWNQEGYPIDLENWSLLKQILKDNLMATAEVAAKYKITCTRISQLKAAGVITPIFTRPGRITDLYWDEDVSKQMDEYMSRRNKK